MPDYGGPGGFGGSGGGEAATGGVGGSGYGGRSRGRGPSASVTGVVDSEGSPVVSKATGQQIGFSPGLLSKGTPFSNQALEAALADVNSPSFGAAQTALAMNPNLAQNAAIQASIVNNPALTQTAVQMGLKEDPNKPTLAFNDATLASIAQRMNALRKSPFSTPFTPSLASIPTVNPTFAPNLGLGLTQAFAQATDDDADDTSKGLGLSLGEALAKDYSDTASAIYGAVTDPIGTMESALQTPVGQYASFSLPSLSPTMTVASIANFGVGFDEQGATDSTGFLGPLGVSTFGEYRADNYGLPDESMREAFNQDFYGSAPGQGLYSPDPDSVKGYSVDPDAMRDVVAEYGATYQGPDIGAMGREAQEGTRGGRGIEAAPAQQPTTVDTITGDSGLPQQTPEQIQQDLTALYNSMTEQQRATIDKITQLPEYDLGFGIRYILQGGPLF